MPISAVGGRAQLFGQPVMRITTSTSPSPAASIASIQLGRIRSASVIARPQVGFAGHAIALRRTSDTDSGRATPCGVEDRLERGAVLARR